MRQGLAVDVVQQPQVQGLAVDVDRQQFLALHCLDDLGHAQAGMRAQAVEGCVLGLEFNRGVVTPADFQNETALRAVNSVVEVLLTAQ
ncbi:hypothetical protein RS3R2_08810 [Pseudomonas lactis]|nr:hypothetical protein RS3R2_08810 [Pseudomonas lactis]